MGVAVLQQLEKTTENLGLTRAKRSEINNGINMSEPVPSYSLRSRVTRVEHSTAKLIPVRCRNPLATRPLTSPTLRAESVISGMMRTVATSASVALEINTNWCSSTSLAPNTRSSPACGQMFTPLTFVTSSM